MVLAFLVALLLLISLGAVIAHSVEIFTARAGTYTARVEGILDEAFKLLEAAQAGFSQTQSDAIAKLSDARPIGSKPRPHRGAPRRRP